jgi:hypothetical protein
MNQGAVLLCLTLFIPVVLLFWNKVRVRGKMLCLFARKDKSVVPSLCELRDCFVIWGSRAYDVYPAFVRVQRYPAGWPSILQELVPSSLYDEEDALPKDWVTLETPREGSLGLRAALDEVWLKKLVAESSAEGGGLRINWRKILPYLLMAIGVIGLIGIIVMSRGGGGGA